MRWVVTGETVPGEEGQGEGGRLRLPSWGLGRRVAGSSNTCSNTSRKALPLVSGST